MCQDHYDEAVENIRAFILDSYDENDAGCWVWNRAVQQNGYGIIGHRGITSKGPRGGTTTAHQMSYFLFNDPDQTLAEIEQVHHRCHNTSCVNTDHLFDMHPELHQLVHNLEERYVLRRVLDLMKLSHPNLEGQVELLWESYLENQ